jgi:putative endonuclease
MFNWLRAIFGAGAAVSAGDRGERLAAVWLERERGFRIVARNWRSPRDRRDELDLIAREGDALVFVEVKTRGADALVPGYYAVDARKKRVVRRAAAAYLRGLREKPATVRFDIVEVEMDAAGADGLRGTGTPVIRHFENIPLFAKNFRA